MYYITKKLGKFDAHSKDVLIGLPDDDYIIEKKKKKRSLGQNDYIHTVVFPLIKDWWNNNRKENQPYMEIQDIKDWVQYRGYWGYKMVGKELIPKRSSEATIIEMVEGIGKIQMDFANWGLDIPSPNEKDFRMGDNKD